MKTIQETIKSLWAWITSHIKTTIALVVVLVIILAIVFTSGGAPVTLVTDTVVSRDLRSTVLATGTVTSTTDLSLSFASSGTVSSVQVQVGDKVKKGQTLATLSNQSQLGALTQAQGSLKSAQASLNKLLQGATNEETAIAETALVSAKVDLANTKVSQANLVANALRTMLNAGLTIKTSPGNSVIPTYTPTLSGTYIGTDAGTYYVTTRGGSAAFMSYSGLETGASSSITTTTVPLGKLGLSLTFPAGFTTMGDMDWVVVIPNTESSTYVTAQNAYLAAQSNQTSAIASAEAVVNARQADLNYKKASARSADIEAAEANVLSAQGNVQSASAAYNDTIVRAPADGTITSVDIKVGELASAQKQVMILQDISKLYLEANINEADVSSLVIGQPVEVTLDAFGPDQKYTATLSHIDPASTVVSGVVNYKIKAEISGEVATVRPGMTANMTIVTHDKKQVLVVPTRAILDGKTGKIVRVVTDEKKGTFVETPVTIGIQGDDGTEILSGLTAGQKIVVLTSAAK